MRSSGAIWRPAPGVSMPDPRAVPVDTSEISKYFAERAVWDGVQPLLLSIACFLMGAGLLYAVWLYRHRDRHPLPHATFHRLARAMGLSLGQRLRLWWVARRRGLPSPIALMLCPATFDHHVGGYLGRSAEPTHADDTVKAFSQIRRCLFGSDRAIP